MSAERFWAKVDRSGGPEACWPWTAGLGTKGYGLFWVDGRHVGAHRFVLEQALGRPLGPGMVARHVVCDNPPCVNPAHLAEGTGQQNMDDMVARGRSAAGDRNGSRLYPERRPRGDTHYSRRFPEVLARGTRHGRTTHPETIARGEAAGGAKLTEDQVRRIRAEHAAGHSYRRLADAFGLSKAQVARIVTRRSWGHVA